MPQKELNEQLDSTKDASVSQHDSGVESSAVPSSQRSSPGTEAKLSFSHFGATFTPTSVITSICNDQVITTCYICRPTCLKWHNTKVKFVLTLQLLLFSFTLHRKLFLIGCYLAELCSWTIFFYQLRLLVFLNFQLPTSVISDKMTLSALDIRSARLLCANLTSF